MSTYSQDIPVSQEEASVRSAFLNKVYLHLFAAILAFTGIEIVLFQTGLVAPIAQMVAGNWLIFFGALMLVSWGATRVAFTSQSLVSQYAALIGFIVFEAVLFAPLLLMAFTQFPGAIGGAALVTGVGFLLLTAVAWNSGKDFTFMGRFLKFGFLVALAFIGMAMFGLIELGSWFSAVMVLFAGGAILHDTSAVLHHYPKSRYVGGALQLFASVMLAFWYVLQLFMSRD